MTSEIQEFFPKHPEPKRSVREGVLKDINFSIQELMSASGRLKMEKAPEPDEVPNETLIIAVKTNPGTFLQVFNTCIKNGTFSRAWKRANLILLHKSGKPVELPSSYRPLCMLDMIVKFLEIMIYNRLEKFLEVTGNGLSDNRFRFRKRRSTMNVALKVKIINDTGAGSQSRRNLCVLVTLDVTNAFNSESRKIIDEALIEKMVPEYLIRILRDYLSNRILIFGNDTTMQLTRINPWTTLLGYHV